MKEALIEQLITILNVYKDPSEITPLLENIGMDGHDAFYYLQNYNLSRLLNTGIMNKYINNKWTGKVGVNASMFDFSLSYNILSDKLGLVK